MQNGLHALATVVMHNEAKGVGQQLRTTLHRSAHCAQGRFRERDRAYMYAYPESMLSLVHSRTLRWLLSKSPPGQVAERAQISFKVL